MFKKDDIKLTKTENKVYLALMQAHEGATSQELSKRLGISQDNVWAVICRIRGKFGDESIVNDMNGYHLGDLNAIRVGEGSVKKLSLGEEHFRGEKKF